jgi:hypothetical protein
VVFPHAGVAVGLQLHAHGRSVGSSPGGAPRRRFQLYRCLLLERLLVPRLRGVSFKGMSFGLLTDVRQAAHRRKVKYGREDLADTLTLPCLPWPTLSSMALAMQYN